MCDAEVKFWGIKNVSVIKILAHYQKEWRKYRHGNTATISIMAWYGLICNLLIDKHSANDGE